MLRMQPLHLASSSIALALASEFGFDLLPAFQPFKHAGEQALTGLSSLQFVAGSAVAHVLSLD